MKAKTQRNIIKKGMCMFLLLLLVSLAGNTAAAASSKTTTKSTSAKKTTTSVKKKKTTGKIVTKKGRKYYVYANKTKARNKFIEIKGKTYYFGKNGVMEKGWMKKGKDYYYFDRSTGVQKKRGKIDGIKIKKDGKASKTSYNKKKIAVMIEAKAIMNRVTKTTDTRSQKKKKVFNWVLRHPYRQYRTIGSARKKKGWEMTFANDIFKKGKGCCVSEACAFAFLAHECGYKSYVCDDTGHAWTEINGRVYDTLFAEAKSYSTYYNGSYSSAHLYRVHRLKI